MNIYMFCVKKVSGQVHVNVINFQQDTSVFVFLYFACGKHTPPLLIIKSFEAMAMMVYLSSKG